MKKLLITGLILAAFASYSYAGMGEMGGMPGNMAPATTGNQQDQMLNSNQMMPGMMGMMHQMQGMMGTMEGQMNNMPPDKMPSMAQHMMDMSHHMTDMSKMMKKGTVSQKEMDAMHNRMMKLQKDMSNM